MMLRQNKQRKYESEIDGYVVEYGGSYWGCQYKDGQIQEWSYGPLQNATILDTLDYCPNGTLSLARGGHQTDKNLLRLGRFVKIKKTVKIEVTEKL